MVEGTQTDMTNQHDLPEERKTVYKRFLVIGIVDVLLGSGLLVCGIIGAIYGSGGYSGAPYFTGSFIGGPLFLLKGIYILSLYRKGSTEQQDSYSQGLMLSCAIQFAIFCFMGCIISIVLTAVSGIFSSCDRSWFPENDIACDVNHGKYYSVAVAAVVLIVFCVIANIYLVFYICSNQTRFGARTMDAPPWRLTNRQLALQNQRLLMMQNQMMMQQLNAAQGQNAGGYMFNPSAGPGQNFSGAGGLGQNFQGFHMGPTGYPMGANSGYPMSTNIGFGMGAYSGYSMGESVPPPQSQSGDLDTKPSANPSDINIGLSSTNQEPLAPPPSYDDVTKS